MGSMETPPCPPRRLHSRLRACASNCERFCRVASLTSTFSPFRILPGKSSKSLWTEFSEATTTSAYLRGSLSPPAWGWGHPQGSICPYGQSPPPPAEPSLGLTPPPNPFPIIFGGLCFATPAPGRACAPQDESPRSPKHTKRGFEGLTHFPTSSFLTLWTGRSLGSLRISAPPHRKRRPSGWSGSAAGPSSTWGTRGRCHLTQPFARPWCSPVKPGLALRGHWKQNHPQSPYREFKNQP